jgi:hypothetical protein
MSSAIRISNVHTTHGVLHFTLSGVDVSVANALRRVILSDIPVVVFKTTPYAESNVQEIEVSARMHNELVKQRLSCIPVHIDGEVEDFPVDKYMLEIDVENTTEQIMPITTNHIDVIDLEKNEKMSSHFVSEMFPTDKITGDPIELVQLPPRISNDIAGGKIKLKCKFSVGTGADDGCFIACSKIAYGNTVDKEKQAIEIANVQQKWKEEGKSAEEIKFETTDWYQLDGKRIFIPDSFEFVVKSCSHYTNEKLVAKGCDVLLRKLEDFNSTLDNPEKCMTRENTSTMENSFTIEINGVNYSESNIVSNILIDKYFNKGEMTFCASNKRHPYDNHIVYLVAFPEPIEKPMVLVHFKEGVQEAIKTITKVKELVKQHIK